MANEKKEQPKTDDKKQPTPTVTQANKSTPDPKQNVKPQTMKFSDNYKEK